MQGARFTCEMDKSSDWARLPGAAGITCANSQRQ